MKRIVRRCMVLFLAGSLAACSTPGPAPVTDRDHPARIKYKTLNLSEYYRVKAGDTLYSIAWRAGLDYQRLAAWNGIRPPYTIFSGQTLRLRAPKTRTGPQKHKKNKKADPGKVRTTQSRTTTTQKSAKSKIKIPPKQRPASGKRSTAVVPATRMQWRWPTQGRLAVAFSTSDRADKGIKIKGRLGQSVRAAEAGKIVYSGSGLIGYGRLIIIKHKKNFLSAYGLNRKILVKEGDQVAKGEQIAEMGRSADGQSMLHFEIRHNGTPIDPVPLLPDRK